MMQVEMFIGAASDVKGQVNEWLLNHPNTAIHHIKQSESMANNYMRKVTISVWYTPPPGEGDVQPF